MIELDVSHAFAAGRWTDITAKVRGCTAAFVSSDMLVAVLATSSAAEASDEYPQVQQAIREARIDLQRPIDAYLLLVVPDFSDEEYPRLREALDDTLICRKAVIALGKYDASSAILRQFPLLADIPDEWRQVGPAEVLPEPGPDELELLDRSSPEVIVDELLAKVRKPDGDSL